MDLRRSVRGLRANASVFAKHSSGRPGTLAGFVSWLLDQLAPWDMAAERQGTHMRAEIQRGTGVKATRRFADDVLAAIRKGMVIGLRAGTQPHRFIALWAVVVEGRVFVRSWSLKPRSWYRTILAEPRGV